MIQTKRLILRPFLDSDFEFLRSIFQSEAVMNLVGGVRTHEKVAESIQTYQKHFSEKGFGFRVVLLKETGLPVGYCGCRENGAAIPAELGFLYSEGAWGKGIATEAGIATVTEMKKFNSIKELAAIVNPQNRASQHVLEKLGFKRDLGRDGMYHGYFRWFYSRLNR